MSVHRRRFIIKTAAVSGTVFLAGCLEEFGDENDESESDIEQDTDSSEDSAGPQEDESKTDSDEDSTGAQDDLEDDPESEEGDERIAVGDQPYTRWIPEPEFRSESDGSISTLSFVYEDAAALRSIEGSLSDDAEILPENALPLIEQSRTDEIILLQTPLLEPDPEFNLFAPSSVILGEFNQQSVIESYLNLDNVEWEEQTEYGDFTFISTSDKMNEQSNDTQFLGSIGVSESVVLYRTYTGENQGTDGIEMLVDAGAGQIDRVHEIESDIAHMYSFVRGSTIVSVNYGEQARQFGDQEEILGEVIGFTIGDTLGDQDTEQVFVYQFNNESSAVEIRNNEDFPPQDDSAQSFSESVDGTFYTVRQTIPTSEFTSFPSLGRGPSG